METSQATKTFAGQAFTGRLRTAMKSTIKVSGINDRYFPFAGARMGLLGNGEHQLLLKDLERSERRFEQKYGIGAAARFRKIIDDPDKSLSDAAGEFGFSREYARQIYRKLYGYAYTAAYRRKRRLRREQRLKTQAKASPRLQALCSVRRKLESMGMAVLVIRERRTFRIIADGYVLSLRLSSSFIMVGEKKYRRVNLSKDSSQNWCHFFICVFGSDHRPIHYIIPAKRMPKGGFSVAEDATEKESKYAVYKEAWHLLKRKGFADSFWRPKNPGRVNLHSRLAQPNPISEEIDSIIVGRLDDRCGMTPGFGAVGRKTV
jgi:AraC-like DNA-binding protein